MEEKKFIKKEFEKKVAQTPLMKQYGVIKAKYPDALLLFRVGDFYETFGEDAIKTSKLLGIVLTKRANGSGSHIELAGFPHHSLETYLPRLVKAGERVAICDQLEDPSKTKAIVKRGVTELVTPGLAYNDQVLDNKKNNYLASIFFTKKQHGISFLDISTGEFYVSEGDTAYIDKLLQAFQPSEVIIERQQKDFFLENYGETYFTKKYDDWVFTEEFAVELLLNHFQTTNLKGFGINDYKAGQIAAGTIIHYLNETEHNDKNHINKITRIERDKYVWLDRFTIRNLELLSSTNENAISLLDIIDKTLCPMGSRLLKKWILLPLKEKPLILHRQIAIEYLYNNTKERNLIRKKLKDIGDIERLISKVSVRRINPRELLHIQKSLETIIPIKDICLNSANSSLIDLGNQLNACESIAKKINDSLNPDCPAQLSKGSVIKNGISEQLDELRYITHSSKEILLQIQRREVERTGITSLKIGFNNVFGYYLDVTNSHKNKVPLEWVRKQTLTNSERYITEELKALEQKILGAEDKISNLESQLYTQLIIDVEKYIKPIQLNSSLLAQVDCLQSLANVSKENKYCKPEINQSSDLYIEAGRHPVIEQNMPVGEKYIPNSIKLDNESQQIIILTGPNMSGKSALLRQTALIVLMAQMGSFVPAKSAKLGIMDKVFTRVGASDNISSGESTFMVEMNESASILNNMSNNSLILLDEIGRGTSTYDGVSIAWAIVEYIHNHPYYKPKVLFATHYHELNEMAVSMERIKNYHIAVKEVKNKVIFLRKLVEGGTEHSFGIYVAKMAGMPSTLISRSEKMLKKLEQSHTSEKLSEEIRTSSQENVQLSFIQLDDPLLEQIKEDILDIDINTLTPVEALMKLNEIKNLLTKKKK